MHPAYSVILFTTASGAGYGLLALLAILSAGGVLPTTSGFGLASIGIAIGLVGIGLASSTFHLGRPERALKAFSQWRSSWLAREGVAAVVTFIPVAIFGIGWVFMNNVSGLFAWAASATALMTAVTVYCTGMIYASLRPIRQWHNGLTMPIYLVLGLMTGSIVLVPLSGIFGAYTSNFATLSIVLAAISGLLKIAYWRFIGRNQPVSNLGTATGLNHLGSVRLLEMPHTEENFLMREMGYEIARKHSLRLRRLCVVSLFVLPMLLLLLALLFGERASVPFGVLAMLSACAGVVIERWLFFAEATHTCTLYYGKTL